MTQVSSFAPILPRRPKALVLGSMPGIASLQQVQYYAHPRNAFWEIMSYVADFDAAQPYSRRVVALKRANIALWDVFAQCERVGSLDSAINTGSARLNDVAGLLNKHRTIAAVFLNGGKAAQTFRRYVFRNLPSARQSELAVVNLPSTSPANARLTLRQKQKAWQCIAEYL